MIDEQALDKSELIPLLRELWLEGELRLPLSVDEYSGERHRNICALESDGLIAWHCNIDNAEGGFDQILRATEAGQAMMAGFESEWADDDHDLESIAGAARIDLAPTWMVTATEDMLRLAHLETGIPRKTIPRRYMDAFGFRLTVRRRVFMGDEPLSPVSLRVKRELLSFGTPEASGPFAGTPG